MCELARRPAGRCCKTKRVSIPDLLTATTVTLTSSDSEYLEVSVLSPHPGRAQPSVRLVSRDARCQHHGSMQSTLAAGMTRRGMTQRDGLRAGVATAALARDSDAHALSRQLRTLAPAAPSIEHRAAVLPLQLAKYRFPSTYRCERKLADAELNAGLKSCACTPAHIPPLGALAHACD